MALDFRREVEAALLDTGLECLAKSAVHEAGHTLALWMLPNNSDCFTICQVWMADDGTANGWTRYNEPTTYTRGQLKAKIIEQLAGKAAELSVFLSAKGHGPDCLNAYTAANKCQVWMADDGTANGWTRYNEPTTYTRGQLKAKIIEQLAGKAAELSVFLSAKGHGPDCFNAYTVANKCQVWMADDGTANGWTRYNEPTTYTRGQLKAKIIEQLAGKAAELSVFLSAKGHGPDYFNAYTVANKCQVWMADDGTANGWTRYNEPTTYTRGQLKAKIIEQLAGKAAELSVFNSAKGHGPDCFNA
uniref:Uncharacterized protein n=1 Tax=Globodera rostochiensis TaxID=31243 RepID=A0A914I3Z3_GLORO